MSLIDQAQADIKQITANASEWGKSIIFTDPNGQTATINGIHAVHHTAFDEMGQPINSKIASVAFSEDNLIDANPNYPIRVNGEVSLKNHRVTVADSTGNNNTYRIQQWFPDDTIGLIVCILSTYS